MVERKLIVPKPVDGQPERKKLTLCTSCGKPLNINMDCGGCSK